MQNSPFSHQQYRLYRLSPIIRRFLIHGFGSVLLSGHSSEAQQGSARLQAALPASEWSLKPKSVSCRFSAKAFEGIMRLGKALEGSEGGNRWV